VDTKGLEGISIFCLRSRLRIAILLTQFLISLCSTLTVWGQSIAIRSYAVPNHGKLELAVPKDWKDSVRQPSTELPPSITFSPARGTSFKLLITPVWSVTSEAGFNSPQKIRELLESRGKRLLPSAVEKELIFQELRGAKTAGYFFSLTDRSAKPSNPDDYMYMTQGAVGLGNLMVLFTFFSNDKESPQKKAALEALKNAWQKRN
jgi:hypothetical protein